MFSSPLHISAKMLNAVFNHLHEILNMRSRRFRNQFHVCSSVSDFILYLLM